MPDLDYEAKAARALQELGIPLGYGSDRGMLLHREASELVSIGPDMYGREQQLTPRAAGAWAKLREAALSDGITLLLVSAFRSLERQKHIIQRQLSAGTPIEHVLLTNAAPGYSEHHTGRAIDLVSPSSPELSEQFEQTREFDWLTRHAAEHGFWMSYPRGNPFGISYEPWHWAYREG
jgi:zinc D-Ala-D-Ala carboxypeptidase